MCIGGSPSPAPRQQQPVVPAAPPPPPVQPTRDDPEIIEDADAKRKRILARRGIKANILTGPLGLEEDVNVGTASLLG